MSPLLLFAALYGVPEAPQDRSGAISKTFAAKICGTTDTLFVTGIQRAFPHSLGPLQTERPANCRPACAPQPKSSLQAGLLTSAN